jgi:hypothetical protein
MTNAAARMLTNEQLREIVRMAESREAVRIGAALPIARKAIARRWKIAAGTLSNFSKARVKDVRSSVLRAIGSGLLSDLNNEISRLEHERKLLLECGFGVDSSEAHEVEDVLAKVRAAYGALSQ